MTPAEMNEFDFENASLEELKNVLVDVDSSVRDMNFQIKSAMQEKKAGGPAADPQWFKSAQFALGKHRNFASQLRRAIDRQTTLEKKAEQERAEAQNKHACQLFVGAASKVLTSAQFQQIWAVVNGTEIKPMTWRDRLACAYRVLVK